MGLNYKEDIENAVIDSPLGIDVEAFDELDEVYYKAKKLDEIYELMNVPISVEKDKTMIARKKPVEVEVIQFVDIESAERIELWANQKAYYYVENHTPYLKIKTLEGYMIANIGDYIIQDVQGEFYACKPDIFHKTYEILKGV